MREATTAALAYQLQHQTTYLLRRSLDFDSQCNRDVVRLTCPAVRVQPPIAIQSMDGCGHDFYLKMVHSRWRSVAGSLIVLKTMFAHTQATEKGEELPPNYSCRSRSTHNVTSARSRQRRFGGTAAVARELQFHVNNLAPLLAVCSAPWEWNAGLGSGARVQLARSHAHSASTQPPRGASTEAPSS